MKQNVEDVLVDHTPDLLDLVEPDIPLKIPIFIQIQKVIGALQFFIVASEALLGEVEEEVAEVLVVVATVFAVHHEHDLLYFSHHVFVGGVEIKDPNLDIGHD